MPRVPTAFNAYSVKFSPFIENRIAVSTAQNFGIIGNGKQHIFDVGVAAALAGRGCMNSPAVAGPGPAHAAGVHVTACPMHANACPCALWRAPMGAAMRRRMHVARTQHALAPPPPPGEAMAPQGPASTWTPRMQIHMFMPRHACVCGSCVCVCVRVGRRVCVHVHVRACTYIWAHGSEA